MHPTAAPDGASAVAAEIAAQYDRIRLAKLHLTQTLNPEHRAELRTAIGEASDRIRRLQQRQMQEATLSDEY